MARVASIVALALLAGSLSIAAQGGPYDRQRIDDAAASRGRKVYAQHCINCHGSNAKGTERGPDLIRSLIVLRDRLGSDIGPALSRSDSHQALLSDDEVVDLSHFLHERIELIASNRTPRGPLDVLTGDPEEGRRYFHGAGTCSTCHDSTGDLRGIASRIPDATNLQQRWLFPSLRRDGPRQVTVTVRPSSGPTISGRLVGIDDFFVSLRDAEGKYHAFTRRTDLTVTVDDPLAAHHDLLDRYTDADMHNLTAYLATLR